MAGNMAAISVSGGGARRSGEVSEAVQGKKILALRYAPQRSHAQRMPHHVLARGILLNVMASGRLELDRRVAVVVNVR